MFTFFRMTSSILPLKSFKLVNCWLFHTFTSDVVETHLDITFKYLINIEVFRFERESDTCLQKKLLILTKTVNSHFVVCSQVHALKRNSNHHRNLAYIIILFWNNLLESFFIKGNREMGRVKKFGKIVFSLSLACRNTNLSLR